MSISVLNTDSDLTGKTLITAENAYTITGAHTFSRNPGAPFIVTAGSAFVPNLGCDAAQIGGSGTVPTANLGTGSANAHTWLWGTNVWQDSDVAWGDFSGSSTIVGWASFTTKSIFYKRLGSLIMVAFDLGGTSNSTSATFTLPIAANGTNPAYFIPLGLNEDNGNGLSTPGFASLSAGGSTVSLFTTMNSGAWTNTGTKRASGQFFYQI